MYVTRPENRPVKARQRVLADATAHRVACIALHRGWSHDDVKHFFLIGGGGGRKTIAKVLAYMESERAMAEDVCSPEDEDEWEAEHGHKYSFMPLKQYVAMFSA